MTYAKGTTVSTERTFTEIRTTLKRYKAEAIGTLETDDAIQLGFRVGNRNIRFTVPLPDLADMKFKGVNQHARTKRSPDEMDRAYKQAVQERWRSLLLVIKAKLESVQSGIETLDQAFLAQLEAPGDPQRRTVGEVLIPQIERGYAGDPMPLLLSGG